jgi:hypothetical protein
MNAIKRPSTALKTMGVISRGSINGQSGKDLESSFLRLVALLLRLMLYGALANTVNWNTSGHRIHPHRALVAQTRRIYSNQHRPRPRPRPRQEVIMQSASHSTTRMIRFAIWALMMFTAFLVTEEFKPQKAIIVPCVFVAFFVPMVLLPLQTKKN